MWHAALQRLESLAGSDPTHADCHQAVVGWALHSALREADLAGIWTVWRSASRELGGALAWDAPFN